MFFINFSIFFSKIYLKNNVKLSSWFINVLYNVNYFLKSNEKLKIFIPDIVNQLILNYLFSFYNQLKPFTCLIYINYSSKILLEKGTIC